jgi:hypothetical protein
MHISFAFLGIEKLFAHMEETLTVQLGRTLDDSAMHIFFWSILLQRQLEGTRGHTSKQHTHSVH